MPLRVLKAPRPLLGSRAPLPLAPGGGVMGTGAQPRSRHPKRRSVLLLQPALGGATRAFEQGFSLRLEFLPLTFSFPYPRRKGEGYPPPSERGWLIFLEDKPLTQMQRCQSRKGDKRKEKKKKTASHNGNNNKSSAPLSYCRFITCTCLEEGSFLR